MDLLDLMIKGLVLGLLSLGLLLLARLLRRLDEAIEASQLGSSRHTLEVTKARSQAWRRALAESQSESQESETGPAPESEA